MPKRKQTVSHGSGRRRTKSFYVPALDEQKESKHHIRTEADYRQWDEEDGSKSRHLQEISVLNNPSVAGALQIQKLPLKDDKVKQNPLQEADIIPRLGSSVLIVGTTGQGKSNLLGNFLTRPDFMLGEFDKIKLFAMTGLSDPTFAFIAEKTGMKKDRDVFTNPEEMIDKLDEILSEQKSEVDKHKGAKKESKRLAIIFEDVTGNIKLMNSEPFIKCFVQNRHFGITVFACAHKLRAVTRVCRLQAHNTFIFPCSKSEIGILVEEECPHGLKPKDFERLIDEAFKGEHSFLHINKRVPESIRFRKKLDTVLTFDPQQSPEQDGGGAKQ
jgi:hypothetical protein